MTITVNVITIHIIPLTIITFNMKEMLRTLRDVYKEDPKEFISGVFLGITIFTLGWFLLWFGGTFMYDM
jgi:hypothetical protein